VAQPGRWKLSLRSLGELDTTAFTKHFGGGGHRNASSCSVAEDVLRQIQQP
jgi:nanoRNase/pAp phosphatase (c-di-AMP/oligoRNAs hydrolase)